MLPVYTAAVGQPVLKSPGSVRQQLAMLLRASGAELIVLPEFVTHAPGLDEQALAAVIPNERARATALRWIAHTPTSDVVLRLAEKAGVAVVFGCLDRADGRLVSRAIFYDPQTGARHHYDKAHVHPSEGFLSPGDAVARFETRFGRLGMLICYDAAFAEAGCALSASGVDVICVLSAVPVEFDWRIVHRRLAGLAVFTQSVVLGAQLGATPLLCMGGHSAIFSAEGALLAAVEDAGFGFAAAEIDLAKIASWRQREPLAAHRRPELYRALAETPGRGGRRPHVSAKGRLGRRGRNAREESA